MHEVVKWAGALASLVGFALAMGVNPALYGATANLLARGKGIVSRLSWMLAGLAVGATVLLAVLQVFNPTSELTALRDHATHAMLNRWVDLIAGVMFLIFAVGVVWWRLTRPLPPPKPAKPPKENSAALSYFGIGIGSAVIGFTTWPLMYLVGRVVSAVSEDLILRAAAYILFLIALGSPFILLAWVWSRFPRATEKITGFYTRALHSDFRWVLAALLAVAGLVFLALAAFWHR